MKFEKLLSYLLLFGFFGACSPKVAVVTYWQSDKIALDAQADTLADSSYLSYIHPFKVRMEAEMGAVIGTSAVDMKVHRPESLLSNLVADVYWHEASGILGSPVDVAVVNLGGIRAGLPAGDITRRKIFEIMPFENELVILWLRGEHLIDLLEFFASVGGQGVSGLQMEIRNQEAVNILVGGQPIEMDKMYTLATNDYLAAGNDGMTALNRAERQQPTGLKIRDMLMRYVQKETAAGRHINATLDGRIRVINE
ncbi:MAG: 5'-nucleotidase C-terminal domain-containing protein [Bacteroidetes bacterium]|nr:5'-nucleotidase C-terminal domain-containing protein [Bacteroidota bacterium]